MNKRNYWLEEFEALSIKGKDSIRFLNGLTTSNMKLQNEVVQTCWLTPKGALRAILEIYFYENDIIIIALEGDLYEIKKFFEDMIFPTDDILLSDTFKNFRIQEVYDLFQASLHSNHSFHPTSPDTQYGVLF